MPDGLAAFLGVVLLAYLVPGPDFLVIVRAAAQRASLGRAAALGAQTGLCVHMAAAGLGLSVVAARSALLFTAIKLAGAAYLVYLGVRALLASRQSRRTQHPTAFPLRAEHSGAGSGSTKGDGNRDGEQSSPGQWRRHFTAGLLSNVLNPKAALFFLSVLPQFVTPGSGPAETTRQIFLLGAVDIVAGLFYWAFLVSVAAQLRTLLSRSTFRRWWDRVTGSLFIALGIGVTTAN